MSCLTNDHFNSIRWVEAKVAAACGIASDSRAAWESNGGGKFSFGKVGPVDLECRCFVSLAAQCEACNARDTHAAACVSMLIPNAFADERHRKRWGTRESPTYAEEKSQ